MEILEIEAIDRDLFIGTNLYRPATARGSYGGHIVAHLMKAALMTLTADTEFIVSSFHCYFIAPVQPEKVIYYVNSKKDGRTFCFRSVLAIQNGKVVSQCMLSFQSTSSHISNSNKLFYIKDPMPSVPEPTNELCMEISNTSVHAKIPSTAALTRGIFEFRLIVSPDWEILMKQRPMPSLEPKVHFWCKLKDPLMNCNDENHHRIFMSYISDWMMVGSIKKKFPNHEYTFTTSLDHSLWFHGSINFYQWHVFEYECCLFENDQSLNTLKVYRENGTLAVSGTQQAIIRAKL